MNPIVIFDIDGTLSDPTERMKFLEKKDYFNFYGEAKNDPANAEMCSLAFICYLSYDVYFLTGRPECIRDDTLAWLQKHVCNAIKSDRLLMRKNSDYRKDYVLKEEWLQELKKKGDIFFAVEDRQQVVDMYRRNEVICLQCKEGNY